MIGEEDERRIMMRTGSTAPIIGVPNLTARISASVHLFRRMEGLVTAS